MSQNKGNAKKRKLDDHDVSHSNDSSPPNKKLKLQPKQSKNTPPDKLTHLRSFNIEQDLIQSDEFITFKGNFGDTDKPSIVKIRACKPKASELKKLMPDMELSLAGEFGKGFGFYKAKCVTTNSFNVDVIYPWIEPDTDKKENEEQKKQRLQNQQKIFDKFYQRNVPKKSYMVRETPEMYHKIALPYIQSIPVGAVQWVYDILEEKREANRIVVKDNDKELGFVTLPDSKWKSHPNVDKVAKSDWKLNESVASKLYLICMVRDRAIKSLRDLRGKHVRLLENLLSKTLDGIKEVYGVNKNELRVFVHYPPQYWHFHIHFTCLAIDYGIYSGKAILLEDIIDNLKMDPAYYEKANISCVVFEDDKLLQ